MIILTGVKCWWAKLIAITVTGDHSNPFERLPHDVRAGRIMMHMSVLLDLLLRQRVLFLSIEVEDNVSMKVRVHEKPSSHRHLTGIPEIVCRHCRTSGSPRQDAVLDVTSLTKCQKWPLTAGCSICCSCWCCWCFYGPKFELFD